MSEAQQKIEKIHELLRSIESEIKKCRQILAGAENR